MIVAAEKDSDQEAGLCCPSCGCPQSRVYYTRDRSLTINGKAQGFKLRVRICSNENCGRKFTSSEKVQG